MQRSAGIHLPSLAQFIVSGFGLSLFLAAAAGLLLVGLMSVVSGSMSGEDALPLLSVGWTALAVSLLLVPSLGYAILRLFGRDGVSISWPGGLRLSALLLVLWPALLAAGQLLSNSQAAWIFLPPLQVLVVAIPLWFLVEIGRRGLNAASPQRSWGLLGFGLLITPTLIITVEIVLLGILVVVFGVWLVSQPQLADELNRLGQRLMNSQMDPETTMRILRPYLQQPLVIYSILAILAVIIPLVEELLKTLGVWSIASARLTPAGGFVAGLLSGAAFALIESTGMLASPAGDTWAITVFGRMGTGMLHTVTGGLVGWGLASAWSGQRYLRLAGIFFLAVVLHGVWNALGVITGLSADMIPAGASGALSWVARLAPVAPIALGVLALVMFAILVEFNRRLREEQA